MAPYKKRLQFQRISVKDALNVADKESDVPLVMEKPAGAKTIKERRKDELAKTKIPKVDMAAFEARRQKVKAFAGTVGTYVHPAAGAAVVYAAETVQPAPEVHALFHALAPGDDWKAKTKRAILGASGIEGQVGLAKGIRDQLANPNQGSAAISETYHSYENYKKIQAEQAGKYIKQGDGHSYPALMPEFEMLD